jgi:hypothetical protein
MYERLKPEDLPLWELKYVHLDLLSWKQRQEKWRQEVPGTGLGRYSAAKIQEGLRATDKMIAIIEKAYAASMADAERLCPGRAPFPFVGAEETCGYDIRPRVAHLTQQIEEVEQDVEDVRRWMGELPDDTVEARKLAQARIDQAAKFLEDTEKSRTSCLASIEESIKRAQVDAGGQN